MFDAQTSMKFNALKDCCRNEALKNVRKHQAVAVCDQCGLLLLGYGNESDFQKMCDTLDQEELEYAWENIDGLYVVAKVKKSGTGKAAGQKRKE